MSRAEAYYDEENRQRTKDERSMTALESYERSHNGLALDWQAECLGHAAIPAASLDFKVHAKSINNASDKVWFQISVYW